MTTNFVRQVGPWLLALAVLAPGRRAAAEQPIPDWVHDALVIANPAAAVGGCQAGVYSPAANGVRPWRQALIRWLTGRHVMGNTAVLVRQEGAQGGAGLTAIIDRQADYLFQVDVFLPSGLMFGDRQDKELQVEIAVLSMDDRVIARAPVKPEAGKWTPCEVAFSSGRTSEVRCVVRACAPRRLPCFYYADLFRLTRKDYAWWSPQNVFDEPRTAVRLADERERLIKTLDLDVVGGHNGLYLNWDGFYSRQGFAVGGGQWEQEYNHVGTDDPLAAQFADNGLAREIDGQSMAKVPLWPGFHMCHNAPLWHASPRDRLVRRAPDVEVISQDNICAPSFEQAGKGCFCRWCRDGFRDWLRKRWTGAQFRAAGVADPAQFDIVEYVKRVRPTFTPKNRDALLANPLLRAFIQYHYASQLVCWRDNVTTAKQKAGHSLVVCGNQWGGGGQRPFCVALSQISDAVVVETGGGPLTPQSRAWDALASKLSLAAGQYRRPVWLYMTSLFHAAEAARSRLRLTAAQAWADGGVPNPWATAAGASGWFYDAEAHLCQFIQRHRALFARRERCANVGLVYSLPTHAWRQFRAFNLAPAAYRQWFVGWAQLLEEAHVPYEVNCWSHPLLGADRDALARLQRYQVLVLPGVDCFSDAQRDAVRVFQARGGRVITLPAPISYDADAVARPSGQTLAAEGANVFSVDPDALSRYAKGGAGKELQAVLERALAADKALETDAPPEVWANLWLDDTRQVLALHLVNGRIDAPADRFVPLKSSRWRVRLPAGLKVDRALAITPDAANVQAEVAPLLVEVSGGWATVVVPCVESYFVVALSAGDALTAATDLANARRACRRVEVIRRQADPAVASRVQEALSLLREGRFDRGVSAARQLARESEATLRTLLNF